MSRSFEFRFPFNTALKYGRAMMHEYGFSVVYVRPYCTWLRCCVVHTAVGRTAVLATVFFIVYVCVCVKHLFKNEGSTIESSISFSRRSAWREELSSGLPLWVGPCLVCRSGGDTARLGCTQLRAPGRGCVTAGDSARAPPSRCATRMNASMPHLPLFSKACSTAPPHNTRAGVGAAPRRPARARGSGSSGRRAPPL